MGTLSLKKKTTEASDGEKKDESRPLVLGGWRKKTIIVNPPPARTRETRQRDDESRKNPDKKGWPECVFEKKPPPGKMTETQKRNARRKASKKARLAKNPLYRKPNPPRPKKPSRPELPTGKAKRRRLLMEHWPALFDDKKLRPLQMGIRDALIQDALERKLDVDTRQIVRGLQAWAQRPAYIRCVAAGGQRYGIDGRAVGEVSGADIEGAIDRIIALGSASRWTKG